MESALAAICSKPPCLFGCHHSDACGFVFSLIFFYLGLSVAECHLLFFDAFFNDDLEASVLMSVIRFDVETDSSLYGTVS